MEGATVNPRIFLDPIDEWLHNEGFFRKHCPKDSTCLFRAVSEQVYLTQDFHIRVRNECVDFMRKNQQLFEEKISFPYDSYLEQMGCVTEWGGIHEIEAIALRYEREIIVFDGHTLSVNWFTDYGFTQFISLCFTSQNHYESVYTQEFFSTAAFCQSMVYQSYKKIFKMENVDDTVNKMIHDRAHSFNHDKLFAKENLEKRESLSAESLSKVEEEFTETDEMKIVNKGNNIYFDIWDEMEERTSGWTRIKEIKLQVGDKCLVEFDLLDDLTNNNVPSHLSKNKNGFSDERASIGTEKKGPILFSGHIQEMAENEGPVVIFILELGEKRTVPYSALRPIPARKVKPKGPVTTPKKSLEQSSKFKKFWSPAVQRSEDQINGSPLPLTSERNANKPTPSKKKNRPKRANECSEFSKAAFGNQCTDKFSPIQGFTANTDFSEEDYNLARSYNEAIDENLKKSSLPSAIPATGSRNSFQTFQKQNATYFLPPAENNYPVYPYSEIRPNLSPLDRANQRPNLSVSRSRDTDCNALPCSDLQSLKFFYNFGFQCYRAFNGFLTAAGSSAGQTPANIPDPQVSQEVMTQIANSMNQKNVPRSKNENSENGQGSSIQVLVRNSNVHFNGVQVPQMQNNFEEGGKDCIKNPQFSNKERDQEHINVVRDIQRNPRNELAPRFRKAAESRNRKSTQPSRRIQQRKVDFYQENIFPESVMEEQGKQYERNLEVQGNLQNQFPQQVAMQANDPSYQYPQAGSSYQYPQASPPYQYPQNQPPPSVYQQPICNEEPYSQANPGFIPIPYIQPVDSGNNANTFPQMVYTGIDNYAQTYVPYYPPYYPSLAPVNAQENWYQFPGPSNYIPSFQFNPSSGIPPNDDM